MATVSEFLTVGDAAAILDRSVGMVRVLHGKGEIPGFRTAGGYRLFIRSDVKRLARERKRRGKQ